MKIDTIIHRFLNKNPDWIKDEELLEMLLHYVTEEPEVVSRQLLEKYENIAALMEADTGDLQTLPYLNEEAVLLLRLVPELNRRYFVARSQGRTRLVTSKDYGNYLLPKFYGARDELVYLLCLDATNQVISCQQMEHGSVNSANIPVRRLVQEALQANATTVVLAHNHPSGIAMPSREDVALTDTLYHTFRAMDICLDDHLIIANDTYLSLRECGYYMEFC